MIVASFDIGKKNFSFCVEEFDEVNILELKTKVPLPKNRFLSDGQATDEMKLVINELTSKGKILLLKNIDLTKGAKCEKVFNTDWCYNMTEELDKYNDVFSLCSIIVIEQQMAFGARINFMALKLAQHCSSYFMFRFGKNIEIVDYPAYNKTKLLGALKIETKTKPKRKKWAELKAKEILDIRCDLENSKILFEAKKKDDLSDVICQLQAYKITKIL